MNCVIYVLPVTAHDPPGARFNENGEYSFHIAWETSDVNAARNEFNTTFIPWASSDVSIDNQIKDEVIADAFAYAAVTITRNDCRIFR